jgi:hypothetical protein
MNLQKSGQLWRARATNAASHMRKAEHMTLNEHFGIEANVSARVATANTLLGTCKDALIKETINLLPNFKLLI